MGLWRNLRTNCSDSLQNKNLALKEGFNEKSNVHIFPLIQDMFGEWQRSLEIFASNHIQFFPDVTQTCRCALGHSGSHSPIEICNDSRMEWSKNKSGYNLWNTDELWLFSNFWRTSFVHETHESMYSLFCNAVNHSQVSRNLKEFSE